MSFVDGDRNSKIRQILSAVDKFFINETFNTHSKLNDLSVSIIACKIIQCTNNGDGGGIYYRGSGNVSIIDSIFFGCACNQHGGSAYTSGETSSITRSVGKKSTSKWCSAFYQRGDTSTDMKENSIVECTSVGGFLSSGQSNGFATAKVSNGSLLSTDVEVCGFENWGGSPFSFSFITYWQCIGLGVHDLHIASADTYETGNICFGNCSESNYQCLVAHGTHIIRNSIFASKSESFGQYPRYSGSVTAINCTFILAPSVSCAKTQDCVVIGSSAMMAIVKIKCPYHISTKPFSFMSKRKPFMLLIMRLLLL